MMWIPFRFQGAGFYTVQLYRCMALAHSRDVRPKVSFCRSRGIGNTRRSLADSVALSGIQLCVTQNSGAAPCNLIRCRGETTPMPVGLVRYPHPHAINGRTASVQSKYISRRYFSNTTLESATKGVSVEGCSVLSYALVENSTLVSPVVAPVNVGGGLAADKVGIPCEDIQDTTPSIIYQDVKATADSANSYHTAADEALSEPSEGSIQALALEAAFELKEGENLDWNNKQLCKISHRNLLLYAYNHLDMATVVKITNQVLAAYQTLPRRKKASQRKQYVQKFLRCIRKHQPQEDHVQLARWMLRCIDLLTCHDLYSMLRVRHILNYDNSFETFRASFGIENFETFSNVRETKEQQNKIMEEKALKSRTAQRNLLMRHLKINKFRFMKEHNVTKAVYEANIEWSDAKVDAAMMDAERFAFVYNLPFINHSELSEALYEVLTRFSKVKKIDILPDRIPPLTCMVKRSSIPRNIAPPPRDKYSPLYALVEFETKEDRDYICDEHIRVFGLICCGRVVYPELAERKHSILTALYPPFRRMTEALQFIANALTEQSGEDHLCALPEAKGYLDASAAEQIPSSQCKITTSSKRRKGSAAPTLVTADAHHGGRAGTTHVSQQAIPDNHVDSSMLESIRNKNATTANMDPQWVVLRFHDFKHAYFARIKLMRKLADEPRSLVSFDTKRSIFHNGKYVDLPLFQYSTRTENDPAVTRIVQNSVDECDGYRSLAGEAA